MKVSELRELLLLVSDDDREIIVQRNEKDGYFSLYRVESTMPGGHIGANGFVLTIAPEESVKAQTA